MKVEGDTVRRRQEVSREGWGQERQCRLTCSKDIMYVYETPS